MIYYHPFDKLYSSENNLEKGGNPQRRMYVRTPIDQMSTLRP